MATRQKEIVQQDFSGGEVRSVTPMLIPENATYQIRNGLLTDDGGIYRRGGTVNLSNAAFGTRISFLWDGDLSAGHRTFFASPENFGVLAADGVTPLDLGSDGLPYPKSSALLGDLLFIGGGYIYGGSLKTANYSTGTITLTNGSKVVTGSGTTWASLTDAGMLLDRAAERVYVVESIDSTTQLTLTEPYEGVTGAGISYDLKPLYKMVAADPYEVSDTYATVQNRLVWGAGNEVRFSAILAPHTRIAAEDYHALPEGAQVRGIAEAGSNAVVFSTLGSWVIRGLAFDIASAAGDPQQQLSRLSDEHVLLGAAGIARWDQFLVVPFADAVYLVDGVSQGQKVSDNIDPLYAYYGERNYRTGQAVVYDDHYFLPILNAAGAVRAHFVVRLDRGAFDRRRKVTFPWTRLAGSGGELAALAVHTVEGEKKLIAGESRASARIVDCSAFFSPSSLASTDADGTAHELDLITRDYVTGELVPNRVRNVKTYYEMAGAAGVLRFSWSDGRFEGGGSKYGEAVYDTAKYASQGEEFFPLDCDAGPNRGADPHRCRVNKRSRLFRLRIQSAGAIDSLVLRALKTAIRPAGSGRR